jgi:imidazolonepropionase-like amidohydrolase
VTRTRFLNANLLDGKNPARPNSTVTVEGSRIAAVSEAQIDANPADKAVDLGGLTLMPGMVTGHFHAGFHNIGAERGLPGIEKPPVYMAYRAMVSAQLALRCGFTGVVGAGCSFDIDASLDAAIRDGLFPGPRVVPCSRDFQTSADANTWIPWWIHDRSNELAVRAADGPADFRRQVREEINRGARMIKVYVTGGHGIHVPKSVEIAARDELEMAVETAHARGARVRVHISTKQRILHAVRCGVDILDHADELDDECIEAIAKAGTFVLPSLLYPYTMMRAVQEAAGTGGEMFSREDSEDFAHMCRMLPKAARAGVRLCIGDDYGSPIMPHGWYGKELAVYAEQAAIPPLEVIRWATCNGGQLLGRNDVGTIEAGNLADMIIVNGDPSRDIRLLGDSANILTVIKDGAVVSGALPNPGAGIGTGRGKVRAVG